MAKEQVSKKAEPKVRVLSSRIGDVVCADGTVIKYQDVSLVSKETADWLIKTFPENMKKVD